MSGASWTQEQLEHVACDYCGGEDFREVVVRPDGLRVVECWRCGLAFVNPRPRKELIAETYDESYFADYGGQHYEDGIMAVPLQTGTNSSLQFVERFVDLQGKRLLDVGCAYGLLLHLASMRGAMVEGVDVSKHGAQAAADRFGFKVHVGEVDSLDLPQGGYDIVTSFYVMEHVPSPSRFAGKLVDLLSPGGWLFLAVPNYRGERLYGERWRGFYGLDLAHLYFFTDEFLLRLFGRLGLQPVAVEATSLGSSGEVSDVPSEGGNRMRRIARHALSSLGLLGMVRRMLVPVRKPKFVAFGNEFFLHIAMRKRTIRAGCASCIDQPSSS